MSQLPADLPRNRLTDAFERGVATALAGHVGDTEQVVVACSGGPDSVATLIATCRTHPPAHVTVAHFDHGLRPPTETRADATFVEELATHLGARVVLGRPDAPLAGDEATAREARYRWLAGVLTEVGARVVVTGHTRDDQAETVLLNLARGGGLRAARGMARSSDWPVPLDGNAGLRVVRPLLEVSRVAVEAYLDALGVEARLDPTNELTTYARNRVRHDVLPALETVNSEAGAQIAAFAQRAREADEALDAWAEREFSAQGRVEPGCARVPRRLLQDLPIDVAKRVAVILGRRVGLELNASQREALVAISARRGARIDLAGGAAGTDGEWLIVTIEAGR